MRWPQGLGFFGDMTEGSGQRLQLRLSRRDRRCWGRGMRRLPSRRVKPWLSGVIWPSVCRDENKTFPVKLCAVYDGGFLTLPSAGSHCLSCSCVDYAIIKKICKIFLLCIGVHSVPKPRVNHGLKFSKKNLHHLPGMRKVAPSQGNALPRRG